jgi:hypothetical protein
MMAEANGFCQRKEFSIGYIVQGNLSSLIVSHLDKEKKEKEQ